LAIITAVDESSNLGYMFDFTEGKIY